MVHQTGSHPQGRDSQLPIVLYFGVLSWLLHEKIISWLTLLSTFVSFLWCIMTVNLYQFSLSFEINARVMTQYISSRQIIGHRGSCETWVTWFKSRHTSTKSAQYWGVKVDHLFTERWFNFVKWYLIVEWFQNLPFSVIFSYALCYYDGYLLEIKLLDKMIAKTCQKVKINAWYLPILLKLDFYFVKVKN